MPLTLFQALLPGVDKLTLNNGDGLLGPQVTGANCWGINRLHIDFDREMMVRLPEGLVGESTSYLIFETANPSNLVSVMRVVTDRRYPTQCELFCHGMQQNVGYTVQVIADILDAWGRPIDPGFNSATFLGKGHQVPVPGGLTLFIGLDAGVQKYTETNWRPDLVPPYVENEYPVPGAVDVPYMDPITFDLKDNESGVKESGTRIWVNGSLIYSGSVSSPGWVVTATPIAAGYHYECYHIVPFVYSSTVIARVYGEDLAFISNTVDVNWSFQVEVEPIFVGTARIVDVFVVSKDLIKLEFSQSLAVEAKYYDLQNYAITALGGAPAVVVLGVLDPAASKVPSVFVQVQGLIEGGVYQFHIPNQSLYSANGMYVPEHIVTWTMRRTKVDSTRNSLARFYDTKSRGLIRGLIEAIMISDEKIGGDF